MNERHIFIKNIVLVGITQLLTGLNGLILLPILTKNLSIEEYGIWAQITATIGIFTGLVMLGLPYTMVRYIPSLKKKDDIQEIFYSILLLVIFTSGLASLITYIFSKRIASILFGGNETLVQLLSLILLFECLNHFFINYFRANEQINKYSLVFSTKIILQIIIVSSFALLGKGITGATIGLLLTVLLMLFFTTFIVISDVGFYIPHFNNIKEYLNFGIPTVAGNFSNWIVNSSDRYVIGILLGTGAVGYYSPGYYVGNIIGIFFAPLSFLLPTILSKYYDDDHFDEVKSILCYSFKYFMALSIPAFFGISLLSKPILTIFSTQEIADEGWLITPFIALSTLFFGAYSIILQIIVMAKKTKVVGKIWFVAATLNLGLNFILIPQIGIIGAAITTFVAYAFSFVVTSFYSVRILKFNTNIGFILKSILASNIMSLFIISQNPMKYHEIVITIIMAVIIYVIVLVFLKGFDDQEFNFFKTTFSRLKQNKS